MKPNHDAPRPVIRWTPEQLAVFKKAYAIYADAGAESFTFRIDGQNHEFVTGYAKYLIEYLEIRFGISRPDPDKT